MTDAEPLSEGPVRRPRRPAPVADGQVTRRLADAVIAEVGKVVLGQEQVVEQVLAATVVGGHVLLEGVPGVAKTLMASAIARTLGIDFRRVQFTPDMLPSDLTGTMVLRGRDLGFRAGPVFTNVFLGDEINRTPPKTQAALLEAMQERQVSVDGVSHRLPEPFLVLATQNPIEYEGTYPLPEAQLDRFHVRIVVGYPSPDAESAMLRLAHRGVDPATFEQVNQVAAPSTIAAARDEVDATYVADEVFAYVSAVVRATRTVPAVQIGASPRAAFHLLAASKAAARMRGRHFVTPDDVGAVAPAVLVHRITVTPEAELERYRPADALLAALATVPVPR